LSAIAPLQTTVPTHFANAQSNDKPVMHIVYQLTLPQHPPPQSAKARKQRRKGARRGSVVHIVMVSSTPRADSLARRTLMRTPRVLHAHAALSSSTCCSPVYKPRPRTCGCARLALTTSRAPPVCHAACHNRVTTSHRPRGLRCVLQCPCERHDAAHSPGSSPLRRRGVWC